MVRTAVLRKEVCAWAGKWIAGAASDSNKTTSTPHSKVRPFKKLLGQSSKSDGQAPLLSREERTILPTLSSKWSFAKNVVVVLAVHASVNLAPVWLPSALAFQAAIKGCGKQSRLGVTLRKCSLVEREVRAIRQRMIAAVVAGVFF